MASLYVNETLTFGTTRNAAEPPTPLASEILVEPNFSSANPADVKHATHLGIYPAILGYDFCGKVLATGPDCSSAFQVGDIVAGYTPTGLGRPAKYGAHQPYTICHEDMVFAVPESLPQGHAACVPVVVMTAADALYNHFKLPLPWNSSSSSSSSTQTGTKTSTGPVIIWGASSSVGISAVQLAVASGASPVLVTASPDKHALLAELGAARCFDYKSETVVGDIAAVLAEKGYSSAAYIFDAVGTPDSGLLCLECAGEESVLVSVAFQKDPKFRMAVGIMNADIAMKPSHFPHAVTVPARVGDHALAWEVVKWVVENYGNGFRFVAVDVFEGRAEDALDELKRLEGLGRGFGKLVLKHPLL